MVKELLPENGAVLDYGCGHGRFLSTLDNLTGARLLGYDPYMSARFDGFTVVSEFNDVPDFSLDLITCLEVCEHLDESETNEFINFIGKKLKSGGKCIISSPIMFGPVLLLKEFCRAILHRKIPDTSFKELLLSCFFNVIPKRAENIKLSHRGYDWRITCNTMKKIMNCEKITFSPIPFFGRYFNSQVFMVFSKRD